MYLDQHTIESMGTARLMAANAFAYEDYLSSVFGRRWVLAGPAKIKGPARLRVKFAPDKAATGDGNGPFIILWVEYNPAMGLFTVWGEYWGKEDAQEPEYKSSPRTGFDNEMLSNPARMFDWLDASITMGEAKETTPLAVVAEALGGMVTAAGNFIDADLLDGPDGPMLQFEPELRIPKDYFVSGTKFPGMTGPDETDFPAGTPGDWYDSYVTPVQSAVQTALDTLYGVGTFSAEVDIDGFVIVTPNAAIPPQNFGSYGSMNLPQDSNNTLQTPMPVDSAPWYAEAVLRMAGVGKHEKLADRRFEAAPKVAPRRKVVRAESAPSLTSRMRALLRK